MQEKTLEHEREEGAGAFLPRQERIWDTSLSEPERIRIVFSEMGTKGLRRTLKSVRDECIRENVWGDEELEGFVRNAGYDRVAAALPDKRTKKPRCEAALLRFRLEIAERALAHAEAGELEEMRAAIAEFRASAGR